MPAVANTTISVFNATPSIAFLLLLLFFLITCVITVVYHSADRPIRMGRSATTALYNVTTMR